MKQIFILTIAMLTIGANESFAQPAPGQPSVNTQNLIPKSPQAAQLQRVGEITVNSARGVPDISFNLYTASVGGKAIPINIRYDASGIKYDDVPSSVGLKWSLSAGGEVSRSINGRPDENDYFANFDTYTEDHFNSGEYITDSAQTFWRNVANNQKDISQDTYSYNYVDESGYIFFRKNKFWDIKSPFTKKIRFDSLTWIHNFDITDEAGNVAYFGYGKEELSHASYFGSGYFSPYIPPSGATAWKLTKLKMYTKDSATFEYDTLTYGITKTSEQTYTKRSTASNGTYTCNCGSSSLASSSQTVNYEVYLIKKITTPAETINFHYSTNASLSLYKRRLDSIVVKDNIRNNFVKKIVFKYSTYSNVSLLRLDEVWNFSSTQDSLLIASFHYKTGNLAGISSLSRDIFGYNNGYSNSYLISTDNTLCPSTYRNNNRNVSSSITNGILDSIRYATGGRTAFFYSANIIQDTIYGPGLKIDSIKYFTDPNTLAGTSAYTYSSPQNGFIFYGKVNNYKTNSDNSNCPVTSFSSEINTFGNTNPFFYQTVEVRKLSANSAQTQLAKEFYIAGVDGYYSTTPIISKRVSFRGNNLSDTLNVEDYRYNYVQIDSLKADWMKLGPCYLPAEFYSMDGIWVHNEGVCDQLYNGVGELGVIQARTDLISTVRSKVFDQNNSSVALVDSTNKFYNSYWQLTSERKRTSKGTLDSTIYNYLYSNGGTVSTSAINNNLYSLVDKSTRLSDGAVQLEKGRANYATQANGLVLPDSFFVQKTSFGEQLDQVVTGYDAKGQITEINKHGLYSSVIRDYLNQYVGASVTNARLNQIAYTSFEADGTGNWSGINSNYIQTGDAATGDRYYKQTNFSLSKSGLTSSNYYTVSYWSAGSSHSITGTQSGYPKTLSSITVGDTTWTLYEHLVTGQSTITVTGTGAIDELRLYPKGAMMTSYTYKPLIGVTSQSDVSGKITYYNYDGFGRLQLVRDQSQKILKKYDYKYASQ